MEELLYLAHRIPYPPNKGDKIRSYHLLKHLSQRYRVHLGAFIDDENDRKYHDSVKGLCGETYLATLNPPTARIRSLSGFFFGQPLTLPYYRDSSLQRWVNDIVEARTIRTVLVFSSAMAQYVRHLSNASRIIDFVDVDSDKWMQYSSAKSWPMSWVYRRESRLLLKYEQWIAENFSSSTFVSSAEADLFRQLSPNAQKKVTYFNNGVDSDYFSPERDYPHPYAKGKPVLVFTGAMDYWANIDAVTWFSRTVFPGVRDRLPEVEFFVVGARPAPAVKALADLPGITVTGFVPDVRPYLAWASLVVAPLRIARGVQNKVLEALAMGKIVVASPQAMEGIEAIPGKELIVAADEKEFIDQIVTRLGNKERQMMGEAARLCVVERYSWKKNLARVDALIEQAGRGRQAGEPVHPHEPGLGEMGT